MEEETQVEKAKESFETILLNDKYSSIIKDDQHLQLLLSMFSLETGDTILDVGTGAGYLAFPLAKSHPDCQVIGLDIAGKVMEQNQKKAEEERMDNLRFLAFDGMHYPSMEKIRMIITRYAFHHFPDAAMVVRQWADLLCDSGRVLVADPIRNERDHGRIIDRFMEIKGDGHIGFYTEKEMKDLFVEYGMQPLRSEITSMHFPFPKKREYLDLFETLSEEEKAMYQITEKDGVVWVGHIDVENLLLERRI